MSRETADAPLMPEVIAFDVIGTLFPLTSLEPLMVAAGGDASMVEVWFSRLLADGFALTAAREYQPFRDVAKASLRDLLPKSKAAARDKVIAGLTKLEVFPDAAPAMGRVVMNARVIAIRNASTDITKKLLVHGRLDAFVEEIISAEDVQEWKPASDPYAFAADRQGVPLERLAIVSAHPWDILGGHKAGLTTGWCNRTRSKFPAPFGEPDVPGKNLLDGVERLLILRGAI